MKTFKKIIATLLVVVMCLTSAPLQGFVGLEWPSLPEINFGNFELPDIDFGSWFSSKASAATKGYYTYTVTNGKATITDVDDSISGDVVIPSTLGGYSVTTIGNYALAYCHSLTSITIPDSVTTIGELAFSDCTELENIIIPDSVTTIGGGAFSGCTAITNIEIPEGISSISEGTFGCCINLNSITIPNNVITIGDNAFGNCTNLNDIIIPDSVTNISEFAFSGCTELKNIIIPDSVTNIGQYAFSGCSSLESLTLSSNLKTVGVYAFSGCTQLAFLKIPANLKFDSISIFEDCSNITDLVISKGTGEMVSYANMYSIQYAPWHMSRENISKIIIEDGVINIGDYAFVDCTNLSNVSIPDSVITIGNFSFKNCSSLVNISIPENVTTIGQYSFYGCSNLTNIKIPDSVTRILHNAFEDCINLKYVAMPASSEIYGNAFKNCTNVADVLVTKGSGKMVYYDDFEDHCPPWYRKNNINIVLEDGIENISSEAFAYCVGLTSITIPDSVADIGSRAFAGCTGLKSIVVPASSNIGSSAFWNCTNVTDVVISKGTGKMTSYNDSYDDTPWYASENDTLNITIEEGISNIGDHAFHGCKSLTNIAIPNNLKSIGNAVFYNCSELKSIVIPNSINSIGKFAFYECNKLTDVYYLGAEVEWNQIEIEDYNEPLLNSIAFDHKHIFEAITITPTCTIQGYTTYTCFCGYSYVDNIIATVDHTWKIATCTTVKVCSTCGTTSGSVLGHSYTSTVTKAATCTETGIREYTCSRCSDSYTETIAATGHTWIAATCTEKQICSACSLTIGSAIGHNYKSTIIKEATCTIPGTREYICSWCSDSYTETIATNIHQLVSGICSVCGYNASSSDLFTGKCGDNVTYEFNKSTGELIISGTGPMHDYDYKYGNPISPFTEMEVKKVVVEDGVTRIGTDTFYNCTNLERITISNTVTYIGSNSFYNCASLTYINLPDGLTSIEPHTFSYCSSLTSITFPDSLTEISQSAFSYCTRLTNMIIPNKVTKIRPYAFSDCTNLTNVSIGDGVTYIGSEAFKNCKKLTDILVPYGVKTIDRNAFSGCSNLKTILIPDTVTKIENDVFYNCTSLIEILVDSNNPNYSSKDGVLFNKDKTALIQYPVGKTNYYYKIPDSVTDIQKYAFTGCKNITSLSIPASANISSGSFSGCTEITNIVISKGTGTMVYNEQNTPWFIARNNKLNITIENGVTNIWYEAFKSCVGLASITIPNSVTRIDSKAFYNCKSLVSVIIPDSVTIIGESVFSGCTSLESVTVGSGLTSIGNGTFSGCTSLVNVILPDSLISTGGGAFSDCTSLTSITLPDSVTMIDHNTFRDCSSLNSITIPDNVTTIDSDAFYGCSSLVNITIPNNVTTIGSSAFGSCSGLTSIIIPNSVTSIGSFAFTYCYSLASIIIPDSITSIESGMFQSCKSLTNITIPYGTTSIGHATFSGCSSLKNVSIPDSVISIGDNAFYKCNNIKDVYYSGTEDQWKKIRIGSDNETLAGATIHYNSQLPDVDESKVSILDDLIFLGVDENYKFSACSSDGIDITDSLIWAVSDTSIAEVVSPGCIRTKKNGLITVSAEKSYSERDFCYVYVGDPTHIEYNTVYDQDYYYSGDGFFSNAAQISNAVDIYLSIENSVAEELQILYDKDDILGTYEDEFKALKEIEEFTITATVSGNDLSFSKDCYSNTYSETFSKVPIETIADDILMLYPYGLTVSGEKKSYTVKVKIESDDFETIEDTITFSISALESKAANEHIDYLNSNATYKASLKNSYGKNMVKLKGDLEYTWSKYSTFDFENYYEVVVADLLIGILNVQKKDEIQLLPKMISEFNKLISDAASTIDTFVSGEFAETVDLTKTSIDKFIKIGDYRTNDKYAENAMFKAIQKLGGDKVNAEKLKSVFQGADKTKQVCKYLSFGLDTINNLRDYSNRISAFNAYSAASDSLKQVLEKLHDIIPTNERKMRDALEDFINFADKGTKINAETVEALSDLGKKVGLDTFTTILGKEYVELLSSTVCEYVGMFKSKSGALLSSTKEYAAIQAGFGFFATSVAFELCLLDILCSSTDKAKEMSKIVAMSEYTPYIVETIKHYENNLKANKDNNSVDLFENAFAIHKASQVYVVDHTVKALEIKRDSIIEKLLNREGEYEQVVADTLSIKSQLADMVCHVNDTTSSIVKRTKVVAIKCPVDVLVYDENGNVVVKIINNILEYCADGIEVCISEGEKYICVPATSEYKIVITATDSGNMDYAIFEYDENGDHVRELKYNDIGLYNGQNFQGSIDKFNFGSSDKYNLITDSKTIYADEDNYKLSKDHKYTANIVKVTCTSDGIRTYNCSCGDSYTETIKATGHDFEGTICKNCDYDKTQDCSCNCHAGGIKKFFFKFLLFFQKIFKKNKECKCGVYHY